MRLRRYYAAADLLGNLLIVALQIVFHRESARIDRLRQDGDVPELDVESDDCAEGQNETQCQCRRDTQDADHADARTAFWLGMFGDDDMPTVRPGWVLVGFASGVCYRVLLARDIAGVRRSLVRRALLVVGVWSVNGWLVIDDRNRSHSYGLGTSIGAICYRLWARLENGCFGAERD